MNVCVRACVRERERGKYGVNVVKKKRKEKNNNNGKNEGVEK